MSPGTIYQISCTACCEEYISRTRSLLWGPHQGTFRWKVEMSNKCFLKGPQDSKAQKNMKMRRKPSSASKFIVSKAHYKNRTETLTNDTHMRHRSLYSTNKAAQSVGGASCSYCWSRIRPALIASYRDRTRVPSSIRHMRSELSHFFVPQDMPIISMRVYSTFRNRLVVSHPSSTNAFELFTCGYGYCLDILHSS
ncbi:hypothetical protein KIN20_028392 [Parelaphostrongylus tenuis]|uniref:Uncharacterized protein n=1 Tax=Parelaphostrongylus tenuis TaxID=148309 RepID=A0AAD5WEN3_PARTN|nr:hypothetical protein KIN20_028392 [Parelaphostrongylus tenuis]